MNLKLLLSSLFAATALAAPAVLAQAPLREGAAPAAQDDHNKPIDPAILIKAKLAFQELKQPAAPLLVDVRSRIEFNAEHIQGAINFPFVDVRDNGVYPFAKDRKLLLYCGCPHHLSGMSADILKRKGYAQVHVIDEGFFGWKQQGFGIFKHPNAPAQVSMGFSGRVRRGETAMANKNIFLRHTATGQLEATRTDAEGRFAMHLHFSSVADKDPVEFEISGESFGQMALGDLKDNLELEAPDRVAAR